jgi:serine/threonine protein kinase
MSKFGLPTWRKSAFHTDFVLPSFREDLAVSDNRSISSDSTDVPISALNRLDEKFDITRLLCKGGFGTVWLACCRVTGALVAVKSIVNAGYSNASREADCMARCDRHDNVVKLLDNFEDSDCRYIVMELCPGKDLQQHGIRFLEPHLEQIAACVKRGIEHLHSQLTAHGDIRLENVMFDIQQSTDSSVDVAKVPVVKIVDFGSSVSFEGKSTDEIERLKREDLRALDEMTNTLRSLADRVCSSPVVCLVMTPSSLIIDR